jgi:hypothetical protein
MIQEVNQQESVFEMNLDLRIAWLAGIMDGEGSFNLCISHNISKSRKYPVVTTQVIITNTSLLIINAVHDLLNELGVTHKIDEIYPKVRATRVCFKVRIWRRADVKTFCQYVLPYLTSKKRQAEICIEFCSLLHRDRSKEARLKRFSLAEALKQTRSSETLRLTSLNEEDKVRTDEKSPEESNKVDSRLSFLRS